MIVLCLVYALISNILVATTGIELEEYNYVKHPTYTFPRIQVNPTPVIMDQYYFNNHLGRTTSEQAIFSVGGASYNFYHTQEPFATNADILTTPGTRWPVGSKNSQHYVWFRLTRPARVYLLLEIDSPPGPTDLLELEGVPSDWHAISVVEHASKSSVTLGDSTRWAGQIQPSLSQFAVLVSIPLGSENSAILPHPRDLRAAGRRLIGMSVIFGVDGTTGYPLTAHPNPAETIPDRFDRFTRGGTFNPRRYRPVANSKCPQWLHESYVTLDEVTGKYWLTWHPMIDPVYWCYFDHEHGSYPVHYRPKFHFTSFYTPDESTSNGRQDESHEGFKVMTFKTEDGRAVVMTLHAHNSRARRFVARHHTFIFAVFEMHESSWTMQMEIHMKADFGFLEGLLSGPDGPIDADEQLIKDELDATSGQSASRHIYTINYDSYPDLDPLFWYSSDPLVGRYEEWRAPMNCARNLDVSRNSGFKFEFHEQQTAMKCANCTMPSYCSCTSRGNDDNLQKLKGDGMRRSVVFVAGGPAGHQRIEVSTGHCSIPGEPLFESRSDDGIFYTDPYFTEMQRGGGKYHLRQFIRKDFSPIIVGANRAVTNHHPWNQHMSYAEDMKRGNHNTEMAVNIDEN